MLTALEERLVVGDAIAASSVTRPEALDSLYPWRVRREVFEREAGGKAL
jgi:hypothetical protein